MANSIWGASVDNHCGDKAGLRTSPHTVVLSIIIPLRSNDVTDVLERLSWKRIPKSPAIEVVVVDDGSNNARSIHSYCRVRGWRYIHLRTADAPFSLSRARNAGIRAAKGEFVYFEDVDFLHRSDFYQRILELLPSFDEVPFNFASVPTLFLTKNASDYLIQNVENEEKFDQIFTRYIQRLPFINPDEPNELCDSFALVGSNIVLRRDLCFHVGLFDEFFNGWGGEDRDFIFRLINHNSHLLRSADFTATKNWKPHRTNAYEGWRAIYRLHGDWLKGLGIYAVHIHHPEHGWKDPEIRRVNFEYAAHKAIEIGAGTRRMDPVPISTTDPINIFIGRNPVFYNDEVMSLLGNVKVVEPHQTIDPKHFADGILAERPVRVFFQNPFGNEWLRTVWSLLKDAGINCICAERGALPWSIYFDSGGFCGDSPSYKRELWESCNPIDAAEYLGELRLGNQFLEPQGVKPISDLAGKLNPNKRTVLVLLQSLTDATTRHFCHPLEDYQQFLDIIRCLCAVEQYNVLVKNHPLNKIHPLPGIGIPVDSYSIYDLFDVSDSVITLNSGAGLLALAAGKQVITLGTAFYAQDGLAQTASTLGSILEILESEVAPVREDVNRFYGYLINDFYSFAHWAYRSRDYSHQTRLSMMSEIRFQKIVIGDLVRVIRKSPLDRSSLLMDPFAYYLYLSKKGSQEPKKGSQEPPKKQSHESSNAQTQGAKGPQKQAVIATPPASAQKDEVLKPAAERVDVPPAAPILVDNPEIIRSRAAYKAFVAFSSPFMSKKMRKKMIEKPFEFFQDAKSPVTRLFAKRLLNGAT